MDTYSEKFKLRLGFFVIGGLALFVIAVFLIGKQKNLFDPVFKLTTTFYNVSGLQVGNNIRFSGINVGTVDNITIINDSTVQVDMLIRVNVKKFIKSDAIVVIGSEGLIGDKLLIITQGSANAAIASEGQHLNSKEPLEIEAVLASLQVTAGNAQIITKEVASAMVDINDGKGLLGMLIHDQSVANNVSQAVNTIKGASSGIQTTSDNAQVITQELAEIMMNINSGNGTLGRLIQDTTIAGDFNETMANLKSSSKGLNENMEAVKNNVFLRGYFNKKAKAANQKIKQMEKEEADKKAAIKAKEREEKKEADKAQDEAEKKLREEKKAEEKAKQEEEKKLKADKKAEEKLKEEEEKKLKADKKAEEKIKDQGDKPKE